jgi:hypothetical protein
MLMHDGDEAMTIMKTDENKLAALVVEFMRYACHTVGSWTK